MRNNREAKPAKAWKIDQALEYFRIPQWSDGYFTLNDQGEIVVLADPEDPTYQITLTSVLSGIKARGIDLPCLIRIENLIESQINKLCQSFANAIEHFGYQNRYMGVFPVKVNQGRGVVETIVKAGLPYSFGLEAGSKAELIASVSAMEPGEAPLICNGYKDQAYIELALFAVALGMNCILVVELPQELDLILEASRQLGIRPILGLRGRLNSEIMGKWKTSSGEGGLFGLSHYQILQAVERLRQEGYLDCLKLFHCHMGSQIPDLKDIETGVLEAARIYAGLHQEGAPMGFLDLGGGLGVDYEGTHSTDTFSRNYNMQEYCHSLVQSVVRGLADTQVPHPAIITESGRATAAYFAVLLTQVLEVRKPEQHAELLPLASHPNPKTLELENLFRQQKHLSIGDLIEKAQELKASLARDFKDGVISLREWAWASQAFQQFMKGLSEKKIADDDQQPSSVNLLDVYICNFSIFRSIPDIWGIKQVFPILPINRLNEKPQRKAVIADITCDSDGRIASFISSEGMMDHLLLHELSEEQEYVLGIFLVGAYQETLGDFHNLFGDTSVVSIKIQGKDSFYINSEIEGDAVAEVLSYVEYDTHSLKNRFRHLAERAVEKNRIDPRQRKLLLNKFAAHLSDITYLVPTERRGPTENSSGGDPK